MQTNLKKLHISLHVFEQFAGTLWSGIGNEELPKGPFVHSLNQFTNTTVVQFIEYIIEEQDGLNAFSGFELVKLGQL